MRTFERRTFGLCGLQVRSVGDTSLKFGGRAVVYGQTSQDLGGWSELVEGGAATRTLAASPDVRFLINHDANLLLARTISGTLNLAEADDGLDVTADMADVSYARDLAVLLERQDLNQMSFGFWITSDTWSGNLHVVREFDLDGGDVSAVTYPAYPQTSAELRAAARERVPGAQEAPESAREPSGGDLARALRSVASLDHEAASLLFTELRSGKVLSKDNSDLVKQAIEALSSLISKVEDSGEQAPYPLQRAKDRLRTMQALSA